MPHQASIKPEPGRVLVFGNSGSGKSTFVRSLAARHDLRILALDHVVWSQTGFAKFRLDDEIGSKGPKLSDSKLRDIPKAAMTSSAPRKSEAQSGGGALAEALRRASEKGGRGKGGT